MMGGNNMQKKDFSVEDALSAGWNAMKKYFWLFFACIIVAGVIIGIPRAISEALKTSGSAGSSVFGLLMLLAEMIMSIGFIVIALKILDDKKTEFKDLFAFPRYFVDYLGGSVLTGLLVMAGFVLLIVPGIYWTIKFQFFGYCVVDRHLNPIEAMRQSARLTKDIKWKLLGFGLVLFLINILGAMCLFVGLFFTLPMTLIAYSDVYRKLLPQSDLLQTTVQETQVEKKERTTARKKKASKK